jgi:hypothetical protein
VASDEVGHAAKQETPDASLSVRTNNDQRTHLAHKAEHAVDLDTGAVVAVTLQGADQGDTTALDETLCEAGIAVAVSSVHHLLRGPTARVRLEELFGAMRSEVREAK